MRLTEVKRKQLIELRLLLQRACHAPGCKRVKNCPRQCGCRTTRTFKLNTDTAICWEIADLLSKFARYRMMNKEDVKEIADKIRAYAEVTRHHSTKGWQEFFWSVKETYDHIIDCKFLCPHIIKPDNQITNLKNRVNRLKRYPR